MGIDEVLLTLRSSLPWVGAFQACYWTSKQFSGKLFPSFSNLSPTDQAYWASSTVSTVHATIITLYALGAGFGGGLFGSDDLRLTTNYTSGCLRCFVGYLLSDSIVLFRYRSEWSGVNEFLIHHVIIGTSFIDICAHGFAHNVALGTLLFEATTPFVNLRWFFSISGVKQSNPRLYFINACALSSLWFLIRICHGFYCGVWIYRMRDQIQLLPPIQGYCSIVLGYIVGYGLQWFWFLKIFKGIMKIINDSGSTTKKEL